MKGGPSEDGGEFFLTTMVQGIIRLNFNEWKKFYSATRKYIFHLQK